MLLFYRICDFTGCTADLSCHEDSAVCRQNRTSGLVGAGSVPKVGVGPVLEGSHRLSEEPIVA